MNAKNKKGFTLIELLVVISVIGLLSSVVLASLNTARNKARDAAVKKALVSLRAQVTLYCEDIGGCPPYGAQFTTCIAGMFANASLQTLVVNAISNSGRPSDTPGTSNCNYYPATNPNLWSIQIYLSPLTTRVACLDSTGIIKEQNFANNSPVCI